MAVRFEISKREEVQLQLANGEVITMNVAVGSTDAEIESMFRLRQQGMQILPNNMWNQFVVAAVGQHFYQQRHRLDAGNLFGRNGNLQLHVGRGVGGERDDFLTQRAVDFSKVPCRAYCPTSQVGIGMFK